MKKISKILWGLLFIIIGTIIGTNALGLTNINVFFKGWWTLFIIIPCFIGMFEDNDGKVGNLIGMLIGIVLLLTTNNIINFELVAKLFIPVIFVVIGLSLIFNETIKSNISKKVREGKKNGTEDTIIATFSGQKVNKDNEEFKSADLEAIFGGVALDLRNANILEEAFIKTSSIFGGVEIYVPQNVNVKVKSTPIFGGVSNKVRNNKDNTKTIYIEAFCMFGGVDIK